jgi:hypothetical protein
MDISNSSPNPRIYSETSIGGICWGSIVALLLISSLLEEQPSEKKIMTDIKQKRHLKDKNIFFIRNKTTIPNFSAAKQEPLFRKIANRKLSLRGEAEAISFLKRLPQSKRPRKDRL